MALASYPFMHITKPRWIDLGETRWDEAPMVPACAWKCDLADEGLSWDAGVFDLFGIARGARVDRRDIVALYDDPSRAMLERLRGQAIATGGSFTFEARIRPMDGGWRWMRVTADTIVKGGRVTHLYGTKQDITAEMAGR